MKDYLEEIGVKDLEYKTEKISFYEHDESVQRGKDDSWDDIE